MSEHHEEIWLRLEVLNAQHQPLGGTVDIACKPQSGEGSLYIEAASASGIIDIQAPGRDLLGPCEITVTPTGSTDSISQHVNVDAEGLQTVRFIVGAPGGSSGSGGTSPSPGCGVSHKLGGHLVFDNGLAAAGVVTRLYSIGFAGHDTRLGHTTTGADGSYSISYERRGSGSANLQVRVLNSAGAEVTISTTIYDAAAQETLNLVVPSSAQPLASEFQRLASDMNQSIGGVDNLAKAQENAGQQDLTLLNQTTNWDARLTALAALSAQNASVIGIDQEALYAMYRSGLPTDPATLATVPAATVRTALTTANSAGIASLTEQQVEAAVSTFTAFAKRSQLAATTPGAVSTFSDIVAAQLTDATQQSAFVNLSLNSASSEDLWTGAASLGIASDTLNALKLQGKFLYLTFNNVALANALQTQIGQLENLSQLADKDFDLADTWQTTLKGVAQSTPGVAIDTLIPSIYTGATTDHRLAAYAGDLARKVRFSFPTEVTARSIERNQLAVSPATAAPATAFLRAAAQLGYSLGRTPLNAFIANSGNQLPVLDTDSLTTVKNLHRIYQITPSPESFQSALSLGFTSARQIASIPKEDFLHKYGSRFPAGEAEWVYGQAQTVTSVTFNICSSAAAMDTAPHVYSLSASSAQKQSAKSALVEQFPSIATLFGNMDYCECQDCSSVLSPAAYFVDVLQFLGPPNPATGAAGSAANAAGYTPLDVLIGSLDKVIPGRRPDLGALPLTCENTNTAMPYIDLVNEILEYYIANDGLSTNFAIDTGTATTAELTAEPQNILPQVYNTTLKQALYPLGLPFDLWISTVRGFLNYFKAPLAQVLDTLRPVDVLELFTDGNNHPYYRAQIFAESLGLSPSDYEVLIGTASNESPVTANWFNLYGYPSEAVALNGTAPNVTPAFEPLSSAENLAQVLGLTYQQVTDVLETGFLNPGLYPLIYQFQRLGIDMTDAFSYTGQLGYPSLPAVAPADNPQATTVAMFEAQLNAITARYTALNSASSFNAITWLKSVLPASYSSKVLVLADPDSGCNFGATTLKYANGSAATPLDFLKFNLFVRLWKKLGWTMGEVDRALQAFFPANLPAWTDPGFDSAFTAEWQTALVYLAHLDSLNTQLAPAMGRDALLPLWANLPAQGPNPLYVQLFINSSVLNNDWAFDDPAGTFPVPIADLTAASLQTFSAHLASIQGVLGLTADDINAIFADPSVPADTVSVMQSGQAVNVPSFTLNNLSICYRYSTLSKCLGLDVKDMIALKQMSGINPFKPVTGSAIAVLNDDVLFNTTLQFIEQAQAVQASGFTVEDLRYLLRHQFDPVGKYQVDQNALLTLLQQTANGLAQIQSQNALPANLMTMPETLLDQRLSGLIPTAILKSLFTLLTNAQDFIATQSAAAAIDPTPFAAETELSFSYDSTTQIQSVTYKGLLLDWKKAELLAIYSSPEFSALLNGLQQQAAAALSKNIGNILGVWASLVEYEAVESDNSGALPSHLLLAADPALSLSYDEIGTLLWAGYRGVLTDANKSVLNAIVMPSPPLTALLAKILDDLQSQALPAYSQLAGSLLAMLTNVQTFEASTTGVTAANQVDVNGFFTALAAAQQAGTISGPVPALVFSYDAGSETQTISCQGVLTAALCAQLTALPGLSATTTGLLQSVRNSMVALFESLATGLLTVAATDLDNYVAGFLGLDATTSQRQAKAELIQVFLPLQAQSLSQNFVLQTLSSNLSSDPSLTKALSIDTALLSDPSNPGKALLGSFLGMAEQGVTISYLDVNNAVLSSSVVANPDTADLTNIPAGTVTLQFTGYLQVSTDGPYRFFAELGNAGASASLQLVAPSPSALLANPIIPPIPPAAADNTEISQFVTLQGGVFYQFTLRFAGVGSNGARLLVQGENLLKGPLSQITLCPQTAADNFLAAYTLLAKALQILETTGLDEREISYMIANASLFSDLRLSSLPTQPSDANMIGLFAQMLTLIDYADLRKNPAGATDGLIDVFQSVGVTFTEVPGSLSSNANPLTPWAALAKLTRRNVADVRTIGEFFGLIQNQVTGSGANAVQNVTAVDDFGDNKGIRRIWQALQLIQILGIPVSAVTACTGIAALAPPASATPPNQIASNLKNAVKAQYTLSQWQPIAQSVFDPLRRMKRDALVAYLVNKLDLEDENALFEYFLVDPGMEPVVQTSRLRLAMSSLQTFVQRCLLDLENGNANTALNVSPSAIDADWWSWMKRYRVWEANREIFLYPENWMVPEMRTGMTDLFQTLESDLLQGDVTDDLANQAFLNYLTGLELRSRLDVVASYLDQNLTNAGDSTLHVLGRTYGHPHKYFYRTYSSSVWSGWIAVTPDIDGDHIALAIWKGRLNVFWVTYITQTQAPPPPPASSSPAVTSMGFGDLADSISAAKPTKLIQVQLHWCEYYQGKWSTRISSDVNNYPAIAVTDAFDISQVYIRITKDGDESVGEGALKVHLDFPQQNVSDPAYLARSVPWLKLAIVDKVLDIPDSYPMPLPNYSFRITSKNCDLVMNQDFLSKAPMNPYDTTGVDATLYTGSGKLTSKFQSTFNASGNEPTTTEPILQTVNSFALLPCSNPVVPSPFLNPTQPDYVQAGSLVSPFFYKDMSDINTTDEMTFYVQPSLTEKTITDWTDWAVVYSGVSAVVANGEIFGTLPVGAQVPVAGRSAPTVIDQTHSLYSMVAATDWVTSPATAIVYNGALIGQSGGINLAARSAIATGNVNAVTGTLAMSAAGTKQSAVTIVGPRGLTHSNVQTIARSIGTASAKPANS